LVYSGTKPSYDMANSTLTPGSAGDAGPGGSVSGVKAPAGFDGDSKQELQVQ
jgi:hypothetical protein